MGKENPSSDELLGYAMDGFPIYGPLDDDSQLDDCNGIGDGVNYRYHVRSYDQVDQSRDYCNASELERNNWNYILGCYAGSITDTLIHSLDDYTLPYDCVLEERDGTEDDPTPAPTPRPTRRNRTPRPTRPARHPSNNRGRYLRN